MPRVARAPAIPPPPPLPVLSLVLTGQVYLVSVKKGETTNTQTSVGKQNGLVLFTEIFLNYRPSGIWGSYVDSPHLKPPTIHARGRFPGRSLLPTGDRPRQRPFSRLVNVWSGTGWCKATCHPRLGGACEAIGLVRIAQAGVAGAAPSRDVKKGVPAYDAKEAAPGRRENRHHRRSTARSGDYGSAGMRGTQPKRFSSPAGRCR